MRIETPFDALTQQVIGIAYRVHNALRWGYSERVYENAFCLDLAEAGLSFERQKPMTVYYRGQVVGEFVADLVIEGVVLIELKALFAGLEDDHKAQTINYLTCLRLPVGLLINFGKTLDFKRLLNKDVLRSLGDTQDGSSESA